MSDENTQQQEERTPVYQMQVDAPQVDTQTYRESAIPFPSKEETPDLFPDSRPPRDHEEGQLTDHFHESEFGCTCNGKYCEGLPNEGIDPLLPILLEHIRVELGGMPVAMNSGYRCPDRNRAVGGAKFSQHMLANAADITAANCTVGQVHKAAEKMLPLLKKYNPAFKDVRGGIGLYRSFVHVDVRPGEASQPHASWNG